MINEVTKKKEVELFSDRLEEQNLENFKNLLPHFYLNDKTMDRLLNSLDPDNRTEKDNSFDIALGLNTQRRRWFSVDNPIEADRSYNMYCNILYNLKATGNFNLLSRECQEIIDRYDLYNHAIYRSGKIILNGQEHKLFKFLLKIKLLDSELVHRITSIRAPLSPLYFCISRNPVDYLFCATDQDFTSCESLTSSHSGAFYMGLGGLSLDPNRCIMFITNGKVRDYRIKRLDFNHFSYISRSWGIWLENENIYIVRYYPQEVISFDILLSDINISSHTSLSNRVNSKYAFLIPRFQDGSKAFIFLDGFGLVSDKGGHYYNSYGGYTGCISEDFDWCSGFERLENWDDLKGHTYECVECGEPIDEDYVWISEGGDAYCYDCYHEIFSRCDKCGVETTQNDTYTCDDGNYALCDRCFTKYGSYCDNCNSNFYRQEIFVLIDSGRTICHGCIESYKFCEECESYYEEYCPNCTPYCQRCKTHYIDACECQLRLAGI